MTAKDGLVVARDVGVQIGNKKTAALGSSRVSERGGKTFERDNQVSAALLLERNLEAELPKT